MRTQASGLLQSPSPHPWANLGGCPDRRPRVGTSLQAPCFLGPNKECVCLFPCGASASWCLHLLAHRRQPSQPLSLDGHPASNQSNQSNRFGPWDSKEASIWVIYPSMGLLFPLPTRFLSLVIWHQMTPSGPELLPVPHPPDNPNTCPPCKACRRLCVVGEAPRCAPSIIQGWEFWGRARDSPPRALKGKGPGATNSCAPCP